jgi:hypothetical protein
LGWLSIALLLCWVVWDTIQILIEVKLSPKVQTCLQRCVPIWRRSLAHSLICFNQDSRAEIPTALLVTIIHSTAPYDLCSAILYYTNTGWIPTNATGDDRYTRQMAQDDLGDAVRREKLRFLLTSRCSNSM